MVNINLLPWRHAEKLYQAKVVKRLIATAAIVATLVILIMHYYVQLNEKKLQSIIEDLLSQKSKIIINAKENQIKPNGLAKNSIAQLNQYYLFIDHLLSGLSNSNNKNLCFTSISIKQDQIVFVGRAQSAIALTAYLRHWNVATLFREIVLDQYHQQLTTTQFNFHADMNHLFPNMQVE